MQHPFSLTELARRIRERKGMARKSGRSGDNDPSLTGLLTISMYVPNVE